MIFTRRTYQVAIRRSIRKERLLMLTAGYDQQGRFGLFEYVHDIRQINHTRKLQARKRKERK